ncbi:PREDICTED: ankyrin repeat domain-containing protein 29 [Myotis brandtii]|uniref:ankyrin repeat domain-containing protein 29 n=1 Tax=Myotis brandtii TaxID=109478 RepID=UPI000703FC54|nr:PREDICTED: ankyrin repeat domain-containing protein 29 [Myotis brandtii]
MPPGHWKQLFKLNSPSSLKPAPHRIPDVQEWPGAVHLHRCVRQPALEGGGRSRVFVYLMSEGVVRRLSLRSYRRRPSRVAPVVPGEFFLLSEPGNYSEYVCNLIAALPALIQECTRALSGACGRFWNEVLNHHPLSLCFHETAPRQLRCWWLLSNSAKKETPLANAAFWAARRGNPALLRLLLTRWWFRSQFQAVGSNMELNCKSLMGWEASVSEAPPGLNLEAGRDLGARPTHCGTSLLMVASYAGHIDCVRELVLQGADINLQRESGTTALFFAAQQGHNDVVRFLFEFGASTEFRTKDGGTALLAASQYGHRQVVDTLLRHGANVHDQLYDGATALFLAAQGGYLDVTRLLLSSGARVNQPRQDGTAPLWIASQMGHSEVVRVMLLRGADRDAARDDGTTALLKAANKGYHDVIEELLKFSPTLGILKNGTSALHAAVLSGNIKTVALLLEAGADPALRNKANKLPAELTKNERILSLLRGKEGHRKSYLSCIFD